MEPNKLENKIIDTIQKEHLIEEGDKIVLGVSGGPDSICMLNVLDNISKICQGNLEPVAKNCQGNLEPVANFEIVVAHVNHMIREEADEDEAFVRNFCEEKQIDFYTKSIDVQNLANTSKIGMEEAGRIARYDFFEEVLKKTGANKIAVAHNKNDKVETIIMHLIRGTSISGLKGIEERRDNIIRPLIDCERSQIEEYCNQHNLQPRIDKTNSDNTYTRNKIRNVVIPYLQKEFNPNIIDSISRLSLLVREEEEYFDKQVEQIYHELLVKQADKQIILDLKQFNRQEKVIKARIILYTITRLFGSSQGIEKIHIEDIIKLCQNNIGNKFLVPNKKIKILIKSGQINFISQI